VADAFGFGKEDIAMGKITRDEALISVMRDGRNYEVLPKELKNDREIALAAIEDRPDVYPELSARFKHDPQFALDAIEVNYNVYEFLPEKLKKNMGIMTHAYLENIVHSGPFKNFAARYLAEHLDCDLDLLSVGLDENMNTLAYYDGEPVAILDDSNDLDMWEELEGQEQSELSPDMENAMEKKPHIAYVEWETDGINPEELELPSEVELPDWVEDHNDAEDYLSNTYEWLVKSLDIDFEDDPEQDVPEHDEQDIGD
jgi:hypothetical protein